MYITKNTHLNVLMNRAAWLHHGSEEEWNGKVVISSLFKSICLDKYTRNWIHFAVWIWGQQSQILFNSLRTPPEKCKETHVRNTSACNTSWDTGEKVRTERGSEDIIWSVRANELTLIRQWQRLYWSLPEALLKQIQS